MPVSPFYIHTTLNSVFKCTSCKPDPTQYTNLANPQL